MIDGKYFNPDGKKQNTLQRNVMIPQSSFGMESECVSVIHCPPFLTPGPRSMTIFNVWFLILQVTSPVRIWPKVNLFWSDFGEKCTFRVFQGSNIHFFIEKVYFFLQRRCQITFEIDSEKKKQVSLVKKWVLDPKNTILVFWGSNTHFLT